MLEERAKIPSAGAMEGGGDPATEYMLLYLSRKFGPVYVMRGRMPTFPNTYAGQDGRGLALMPEAQTLYWSPVSCEAAPSGCVIDGLTDMQVPLDADGNYTIVVSRPEDRPQNATLLGAKSGQGHETRYGRDRQGVVLPAWRVYR